MPFRAGTVAITATGAVTGSSYQIGSNLFAFGSYGSQNAFLGFAGSPNTTAGSDTAVGYGALASGDSSFGGNTAIGQLALNSDIGDAYGDGCCNTAIGAGTLSYTNNTNGAGNSSLANTAVGYSALDLNTTGSNNTAIGYGALFKNNTGYDNTASGAEALRNTGGSWNTADGYYALYFTAAGGENTGIGFRAGSSVDASYLTVAAGSNTFLGANAGFFNGSTLTNATAVGANAVVSESNALVLGCVAATNNCTTTTSVGIGTTAPRSVLDVEANVPGGLGPTVTLTNNGGTGQVSLDFNTYQVSTTGTYNPSSRILSADNGNYSDNIVFYANKPGAANNGLQETMSIDSFGDVHVFGNLTKQSGSFMIDHPLDPANKYLYHSFVESPDMMNIYNGVATLDARGSVWITLPEYFEALNQDFRYQLTSIGRPQPSLYVAREISGNRFRISGGKPGGRVSWQVTGIRHDAYADAHRIKVEVEKPPQEQGRYLHPELFGAPAEQAIGYHAPPVPTERPAKAETADVSSLKTPPVSLK